MTYIATALEAEVARVARKKTRAKSESLKKAISACGVGIAALKKRSQALEQAI